MLYFDFGFLEQKLRYSGLSNTLGDIKSYSQEIIGTEKSYELLDDLTDFLAFMEEFLHSSSDTSLLQYALVKEGLLKKQAQQQANKFKNHIWFNDM